MAKKKNKNKEEREKFEEFKEYLEKIKKIPPLSKKEEKELWKKASKGDEKAKERIFTAYLELVVKIAKKSLEKKKHELEKIGAYSYSNLLDLIREGEKILWREIDKFDPQGYYFNFPEYVFQENITFLLKVMIMAYIMENILKIPLFED